MKEQEKLEEKAVLKEFHYFSNVPLGDMVYHYIRDKWGDLEEVCTEVHPDRICVFHRLKEGDVDENLAQIVFDRVDPEAGVVVFNPEESYGYDENNKPMKYSGLVSHIKRARGVLSNKFKVKPRFRPYSGW